MATYKVLQDIEAEDKLLGPFTVRQFIYAAITIVAALLTFRLGTTRWFLGLPFIPIVILFGVLAAPFGHDQSSEVWLLAKIRFFLKPRRRIWDQTGMKELVTITAPKRIERQLTKNLSQYEVRSRLKALANTIDSRGWAVKNVDVNLFSQPSYVSGQTSDRLIDPSALPQDVPVYDVHAADDIMDIRNNPTAQMFDQMISASAQAHRQRVIEQMHTPPATGQGPDPAQTSAVLPQPQDMPPGQDWFTPAPVQRPTGDNYSDFHAPMVVTPGASQLPSALPQSSDPTDDEQALLAQAQSTAQGDGGPLHKLRTVMPLSGKKAKKHHKKEDGHGQPIEAPASAGNQAYVDFLAQRPQGLPDQVMPPGQQGVAAANPPAGGPSVTAPPNPAILELASNDDLSVATIARQAEKSLKSAGDDEVVISLR